MPVTITGKKKTPPPYLKHLEDNISSTEVVGTVQVGQAHTQIKVHPGVVGSCRVGCSGGRTVNLGNYNSVKIGAWLEMPTSPDTINETFDFVSSWVSEQLEKAIKTTGGS